MPKSYSIALVGYGRWGKILAKEIQSCNRLDLNGIFYPSSSPDNIFTFNSFDHLIKTVNPEAVVIAAPLQSRYELILSALMSNLSVLAEKPLALTADEADQLARIADERGLVLYTNYVHAYSQGVSFAIDQLNDLGRLEMISIVMNQPGPMYCTESLISLLGSHGFAIAMKTIAGDTRQIDFDLRHAMMSSGMNSALIEGVFPDYSVALTLSLNIAHPIRQRSIDYISSKGTISVQLEGPYSGSWITHLPDSLIANNTVPITTNRKFDETKNVQAVLAAFASALDGENNGNLKLSQSVQRAIDQCMHMSSSID